MRQAPFNAVVSIIIPLYNAEKFIADSILSALKQTWPYKEIIVVDDGSTDNSLEVARQFEPAVKVFSRSNHGACATRNFALLQSTGDYIQYLDADDLLSPGKIEQQLQILQELPPGYISSCGWAHFTTNPEEGVFISQAVWKDMEPVQWLTTAATGGGMMQTACWLTPREVIDKAGSWDESLKENPSDDGEFFCRVLLQSKGIRFCEPAKIYYRVHSGNRVSKNKSYTAVSSLLGNCMSYERNIFKTEHSTRTIEAVVRNYAVFIYEFYDTFPDLCLQAEQMVQQLGYKKIRPAGGRYFLLMANLTGFKNALKIRSFFRNLKSSQDK